MSDRISPRALNRATLARQHLLARVDADPVAEVSHLVGMQAQAPDSPYLGLWSRLNAFDPVAASRPIHERSLVRISLMRATVHLVTASDAIGLRALVRPVLERAFGSQPFARNLIGLDLGDVVAAGRAILGEGGLTRRELGEQLSLRWPGRDPESLAYAVSYLLPSVQATPRGLWQARGPVRLVPTEVWLSSNDSAACRLTLRDLVLRYLVAFGPASIQDIQLWCGLTRLAEVVDDVATQLRTFKTETGSVLYDLADAEIPDPEAEAPTRFLPEYDNLLLSHADRTRFMPTDRKVPLRAGSGMRQGTLLVDGRYEATWRLWTDRAQELQLQITPFGGLHLPDDFEAEAQRLLAFLGEDPARTAINVRALPT